MLYTSRYYSSDYLLDRQLEEIETNFDIDRLNRQLQDAQYNINELQKAIERCQQYASRLHYHKNLVETIKFKYEVYYTRQKYSSGPVNYYTGVYKIPCIPNGNKYRTSFECKRWTGADRYTAKKAAEELAKKYKCDIVNK